MDVFEYVLWFVVSVDMAEMISLISARISAFFFAVSEETVASFEVLKFSLVAVPVLEEVFAEGFTVTVFAGTDTPVCIRLVTLAT